jgi:hypothetical protein
MKQLFLLLFLVLGCLNAQADERLLPKPLAISVRKVGPYFGFEMGRTPTFELGSELMFKKISLRKASVHGLHLGMNFAWEEPGLGFETGYWYKQGRLNMSFGGSLVFRTNFEENRIGFSPMMGYRLFGFHLQAGVHILSRSETYTNTNTFFIRLRFTLITDRKWDVDGLNFNRKKKKKK